MRALLQEGPCVAEDALNIDATPSFVTHRIGKLQDFVHFAPAQVRNPQGMTLNGIDELHGKQRFEAQIISFAA